MPQVFKYERAAQILAEAAVLGDKEAIARHGVALRTLQRYRRRLSEDEKLARLVAEKKAVLEREWASELAPAIREGIRFLQKAAREADASDPAAIHAVAGALKILSEIALTKEVLDARLAKHHREQAPSVGALAPARA